MSIGLLQSVFCRHWFCQQVIEIWNDEATLKQWISVELALAKAQSKVGLIPAAAYQIIVDKARPECIDLQRMQKDIAHAMHPFVPLLHQLEELCGDEAAGYLHWGATTQNIFDTAQALQLKDSHRLLIDYMAKGLQALAKLATEHRNTPQAGRTHGQHALPITFGYKVAGWLAEIHRHYQRLKDASQNDFVVSMGGAVGTFSAMGGKGREVQALLAIDLGLTPALIPVRVAFDHCSHYATLLGGLAATIEKIAHEVVFMQRNEINELEESFHLGKIGSSTMAQKRNPQMAMNLLGLARLARSRIPLLQENMVRMNEGDSSACNVADQVLPELVIITVSLAKSFSELINGLHIKTDKMQSNLAITQGQIVSEAVMMALAHHIGRHQAHKVLYDIAQNATATGKSYASLLASHPLIQPVLHQIDLPALLQPSNYLGEAGECVDAVLQNAT